jgi:hypothetical protein
MAILALLDDGVGEGGTTPTKTKKLLVFDYCFMVYSIYGRREYKRQEASVHVMALPEAYIIHYITLCCHTD